MPRRLPAFFPLALAAAVGLFALTTALLAQPPKPAAPGENPGETIKKGEEENLRMYKRFAEELLRLAQKWEKSESPDDKERAKTLRSALDLAKTKGVDKMYKDLVAGVAGTKNPTLGNFSELLRDDQKLIIALEEILSVLQTEDELAKIKREIADLTELKKEIERIKREQDNIRARTEMPKGDPNKIAKDQNDLANQTKDLANKNNKDGKESKGGEPKKGGEQPPKDDKSDPKAEPKPGENTGEDKPETKESKSSEKDPKAGDPKAGDEQKPSPKNADAGSEKEAPKAGDPMMGGDPKPMPPMPPMASEPKPSQGDSKAQSENKGEPKPSDGKPGGEGKPMGGEPKPPSDAQASAKPPGPPSSGNPPPPSGGKPKDPIQQNLEEAVPPQSSAAEDLKKNDRKTASKNEDEAIKKLEKALEELEKRLKQLREKEQLKLLANLEERLKKMLEKQIDVYEATKSIERSVKKNNDTKSTADIQKAGGEADKERAIVGIAADALKLMEGEGSAVVFAGVMAQVKQDMENIAKRLESTYVGPDTQLIEEEVIAQLQLMLEAVKKAKKEAEDKQNKPNDSPPNPNNPNKNLIDKLAELKLIRSLQQGVNTRTLSYNKQYPGEQINDAIIQGELKQLGDRQKVLQDMLHKMATGANQ